jgi:hypothetical protein
MDFLEKYNAENLQDFAQTQFDFEFFLDDCNQNVNAYGNPDLSLHSILGSPEECFDSQILFDPFEKDFYSPATFVKSSNCQGRQSKVVR